MIKLYPSAELHLLRGQSVELELFMNHLGSNAWIRVNNPLALAPGVALATLSGRLLAASASAMGTNIDFLAIQDGQGNDILKVPVHVSVHDTVLRVMCSHARQEVEVARSRWSHLDLARLTWSSGRAASAPRPPATTISPDR